LPAAKINSKFIYYFRGIKQQQGDLDGTICALDNAYKAYPSFIIALNQAYFLATAGLVDDAEKICGF
jgi:hypothetical protein